MSRRSFARIAALAASALIITFAAIAVGAQDEPAPADQAAGKAQDSQGTKSSEVIRDAPIEDADRPRDEVTAQIEKRLAAYDLKPHRLPPIPDAPPPHEGAMIDLPLVIEPPDLVLIEVLEALPGRPISGERMIRPDGTISLGFYGVVHVRGLTLPQLKVALIKHLRRYIDDETLGLRVEPNDDPLAPAEAAGGKPPGTNDRGVGSHEKGGNAAPVARPAANEARARFIDPDESARVFVDITAYNSKNYYVLGDVQIPGRLPCTGEETVLDAIQFAGGLMATAEPKDIRLVRPGRDGKSSKVYKVDLEAIQEKGDVQTNYQLFPGDRLIVGRNEIVKRTIELDRLHAPIQAVVTSIRQNADMLKSLGALQPERSDQILKDLVDFWAKEVARKGDITFDEQTLREILLRELKRGPSASRPTPAPGPK
jgi:polysaccharide export outer membrane protein